jgi:pheromone shutdown protein TraB
VKDVLEVKNFNTLLVQWLLAYLQRKIGFDVGVEPGAEMKAAIEEAENRGIPLALVDRDIRLTLLRFWNSLGFLEKLRLMWALIISIAEVDSGQEIDIESLKQQNVIDMVMEEFRKFSPNGARALIDERDAFIAHQLVLLKVQRPQGKILAVVGAGHRQGIAGYLDNPSALPPFDSLVGEPHSPPGERSPVLSSRGFSSSCLPPSGSPASAWGSCSKRSCSGSSSTVSSPDHLSCLPEGTRTLLSPASALPG